MYKHMHLLALCVCQNLLDSTNLFLYFRIQRKLMQDGEVRIFFLVPADTKPL